eukprot:scaffold4939_cov121-Isochrysis_galbana.AAC.9
MHYEAVGRSATPAPQRNNARIEDWGAVSDRVICIMSSYASVVLEDGVIRAADFGPPTAIPGLNGVQVMRMACCYHCKRPSAGDHNCRVMVSG